MKKCNDKSESIQTKLRYWVFLNLVEVYRAGRKPFHAVAWMIVNLRETGEGRIYFDFWIDQRARWSSDDLIDFAGPPT